MDISSTLDLVNLVENVVDNDIRRFVEDEGWYKLIEESEGKQESLLQKTIKTQLENSFLRKGFRGSEINVRREEQLLDDKRPDFLVSYGFIGPIPIEIKRTDNKEVLNKKLRRKYRTKLLQYIEGFKADYGMFILF